MPIDNDNNNNKNNNNNNNDDDDNLLISIKCLIIFLKESFFLKVGADGGEAVKGFGEQSINRGSAEGV